MNNEHGLEKLRLELDQIDFQLLNILKSRIDCGIKIALFKREYGIAMMQPQRINYVHERAARFGEENNINTAFLKELYDLLISETCRVEDEVISGLLGR